LGPLEVVVDDVAVALGVRQQRMLLGILLTEANRAVAFDRLLSLIWQHEPPARAGATLQTYVSNLRRALDPGRAPRERSHVLVTDPPGYTLRAADDQLDWFRFERLAAQGAAACSTDPDRARQLLEEALSLWRGEVFGEFADEPWASGMRGRLGELRLRAVEDRLHAAALLGEPGLVAELAEFVHDHPEREEARAQLMLTLYHSGRQVEALSVFDAGRRWLAEELGLEPGEALQQLEHAILTHQVEARPTAIVREPAQPRRHAREAVWTPPFIGRTAELRAMDSAIATARDGRGSVVLVEGGSGLGKTRLLAQMADRFSNAGGVILTGRASAAKGSPPFWPWPQMLRGTPLCDVFSLDRPPERRQALFAAVFEWLDGTANAEKPILLVFDDVHLCGPDAAELLEFCARSVEWNPAVFVASVVSPPPASAAATPMLGALADLPWSHRLVLEPFTLEEISEAVEAICGHPVDADLVATLDAKTRGNPFFTVELARMLAVDDTALDRAPETVRDVVRTRMARLPSATREILEFAALVGQEFELTVVAGATQRSLTEANAVLEPAEAVGVVVPQLRPGVYRFVHGTVRDVVAGDVTHHETQKRHQAIATTLTAHFGRESDRAAQIASHQLAALPVVDALEASGWMARAARHAARSLAFDEALHWQRRRLDALALFPSGEGRDLEELDIRSELAVLLTWRVGQASMEVQAELERAHELAVRLGETARAATGLWGLWSSDSVRGDLRRAARRAEELRKAGHHSADPQLMAIAEIAVGATNWQRGRFETARSALWSARAGLGQVGGREVADAVLQHPSIHLDVFEAVNSWFLGDTENADLFIQRATDAATGFDHAYSRLFASGFHCVLAAFDERLEWIVTHAPAALSQAREHGFAYTETTIAAVHAWALARLGDEAAIQDLQAVMARRRELGAGAARSFLHALSADTLLVHRRPDEALRETEDGLNAIEDTDERYWEPEVHRLRGRALADLGRRSEADASRQAAVARATAMGAVPLVRRAQLDIQAFDGDQC
jgi:DNA-binding SARP family transcriptional activator